MADQKLKQQLSGLFSDIAQDIANPISDDDLDYLEQLFSDAIPFDFAEDEPEEKPTKPTATASTTETAEAQQPATPPPPQVQPSTPPKPTQKPSSWTHDPLFAMAVDPDREVAQLALKTLVQMGKSVHQRVLGLAKEPLSKLHQGAAAYLSHVVGQPMIHIPAGEFIMGSDPKSDQLAEDIELPQHKVNLSGFWIGRFPITLTQFKTFIKYTRHQPVGSEALSGQFSEPVIDVTWHEAAAYCKWLRDYTKLPIYLPSEAQWEKAARGLDGRLYPWGQQPPNTRLCSFERVSIGRFSPHGDSLYGCSDMAGNVWEWTQSGFHSYPYNPDDGREDPNIQQARVVRGLTFNNLTQYARCASRYAGQPNLHLNNLGFRIAIVPE